ncbi:metal ABC transporter substrate-binding protein [Actinomadura sp. KC216]|uniref:metal ABC transporter substrate-binding protein n=1 Tax=Actinomadura sp. KC216 TaxID=2530370 RepID=UPI001FB5F299|nr:metal ABC transporter substrate-binding protein [Actinomadura sp. KC216]
MRIRTLGPALPVLAAVLLAATACGGSSSADNAGGGTMKLKVVATTTQVADFARNIGGDKVTVTQILKPNVDPHDYEPSPADIQAIADADLVVKGGVGLEKWLDQTIKSAGFDGTVVDASKGVAIRKGGHEHGEEHGHDEEEADGDPHIWHNPRNVEIMTRHIAAAFGTEDPADKAAYETNLTTYTGKLKQLDAWIAGQINSLPVEQRKLVTNHDAFGYYIDRYRLTFVGSIIPSFDTSAELSGKQLNSLVAKIKSTGVKAVFSESSLPPKTAETIGREAGVKVVAGEDSLYGDTLGPAGSAGATYLEMERHNTTTIVTALKG